MSNPKRIEELTEATNLHDNDLVFASVLNAGNTYVSKKVTLANIANYVRNSMEPIPGGSESGFGRYEFYDSSETGDGRYDTTTIQSYFDDDSKLLLRWLKISQTADGVSSFRKQVSRDCVVTLEMKDNFDVKINGIKIIPSYFRFDPNSYSRFYLKAGQTLTIDSVPSNYCYVSIFPLVNGCGPFFIDTSDQTKVIIEGTVSKDANNTVTYTAPNYPVLVLFNNAYLQYSVIKDSSNTSGMRYYINDAQCSPTRATGFLLRANDTLRIENTPNMLTEYCQYPLLVDGSGENKSCGYEIYDLSNSDANYINGVEVGNDGFTKRFTRDCEILVTPSTVPTQQGSYGNITVKVDNKVQLCTGLLALGIGNLAQFYVKAGQTLSISRDSGTVKVYSRPLKSAGNFFIDGTEALSSPFTGCGRVDGNASSNNEFTFTAPRKTLFIYAGGSSLGTYLGSVKINGVEINLKNSNNSYNYDKLILDTHDTIAFTFTGATYMTYCALPLLEN